MYLNFDKIKYFIMSFQLVLCPVEVLNSATGQRANDPIISYNRIFVKSFFCLKLVACCLKLDPQIHRACISQFYMGLVVDQGPMAKLFTPGKSVRDRGTNSLTPDPWT